jgi:hypothetical protein
VSGNNTRSTLVCGIAHLLNACTPTLILNGGSHHLVHHMYFCCVASEAPSHRPSSLPPICLTLIAPSSCHGPWASSQCASLGDLHTLHTTSPTRACRPFPPTSDLLRLPTPHKHSLRHATLPAKHICTKNLTPFLKLPPCPARGPPLVWRFRGGHLALHIAQTMRGSSARPHPSTT